MQLTLNNRGLKGISPPIYEISSTNILGNFVKICDNLEKQNIFFSAYFIARIRNTYNIQKVLIECLCYR